MKTILISKTTSKLIGSITMPASKSISNRLLVMRALLGVGFKIDGLSDAEDTQLLEKLMAVIGRQGVKGRIVELDVNNAGTVMRFLTALLSIYPGKWVLTGSDRMKQRPIGILVEALRILGADIDYLGKLGYPPIMIEGRLLTGHEITIEAGESSQYASALLMIAPYLPGGLRLHLKGDAVSTPYMEMTIRLMKQYGAKIRAVKHGVNVKPGAYWPVNVKVEGDWSAAAFWYEAAVFATEVDLELKGLTLQSLQGDAVLAEIYQNFGIQTIPTGDGIRLTRNKKHVDGFFYNFANHPDLAPPVIATCAGLGIRGHFEGLNSLRIKETDRLQALKNELEKLGTKVEIPNRGEDVSTLDFGPARLKNSIDLPIETYNDHRIAMTFAPLALRFGSIRISNPDVVGKSYPAFWEDMKAVGFKIENG
jgi:3-phosphoshikimate 1-carboxyvinyltransferase